MGIVEKQIGDDLWKDF